VWDAGAYHASEPQQEIRECYLHAEECKRLADAAGTETGKADYLDMERRWRTVPASAAAGGLGGVPHLGGRGRKCAQLFSASAGGGPLGGRVAVLLTAFAVGSAAAQAPGTCESRAVSKDGKPLAGAAKNSFITNASETPAHPRRSDRTASPLRAPRKTASWRSACENKPDVRLGPSTRHPLPVGPAPQSRDHRSRAC